jgi:hypothetical protein
LQKLLDQELAVFEARLHIEELDVPLQEVGQG